MHPQLSETVSEAAVELHVTGYIHSGEMKIFKCNKTRMSKHVIRLTCGAPLARGWSGQITCWRRGVVVSGVRRMNEVNARRARLVLGWVTVFGRVYHLGM